MRIHARAMVGAVAGAIALLAFTASAASATTASVSGNLLSITGGPGEVNHVAVTYSDVIPANPPYKGYATVTDTAGVTPGANCVPTTGGVICGLTDVFNLRVDLGDQDDTFRHTLSTNAAGTPNGFPPQLTTLLDGPGNDVANLRLTHDFGEDLDVRGLVYAGPGNDVYVMTPNADRVTGVGAGDDRLYGGDGNDSLNGGSGNDYIRGGTGNDYIYGLAGNDSLHGDLTNDFITGGTGNDYVFGESGNDRLFGGPGFDHVYGGPQFDHIDGVADDFKFG